MYKYKKLKTGKSQGEGDELAKHSLEECSGKSQEKVDNDLPKAGTSKAQGEPDKLHEPGSSEPQEGIEDPDKHLPVEESGKSDDEVDGQDQHVPDAASDEYQEEVGDQDQSSPKEGSAECQDELDEAEESSPDEEPCESQDQLDVLDKLFPDRFLPKLGSSSSQDGLDELDKLFPRAGPVDVVENIPKESAEESEVSRRDINLLNKLLQRVPPHEVSEASCSSLPEPFNVVEYIKGYHFVKYSEENPSELELASVETLSADVIRFIPKTQKEIPYRYLEFTFNQIAAELKELKLPQANWKIMITLKGRKIKVITFTNSFDTAERSVSFNTNSNKYNIIIEGRPAQLVVPTERKLKNKADLETLLRLVNSVDSDHILIAYKTD